MATISQTLSRFLRDSPIALTLASPGFEDCPLVQVNSAFEKLTGYDSEFAVGRNCRFLQGSDTELHARAALRKTIAEAREAVVPITNYRRDGTKFRNLVFVFPILDADGRLLYMLGSQYDVTAPRRAVSPHEYAQMLDEVISLSNPMLSNSAELEIRHSMACADAVTEALERNRPSNA